MNREKTAAKAFTLIVISMGVAVIISTLVDWESRDPVRYYCYSLLALLSSSWRVALPTFPGTISIGYLFVLIGFVDFSFPETLLLGCSCVAVQSALRKWPLYRCCFTSATWRLPSPPETMCFAHRGRRAVAIVLSCRWRWRQSF